MKKIFEYKYNFFLFPFGRIWSEEDGSLYKESTGSDFSNPLPLNKELPHLVFKAPEMINDIISVLKRYDYILSKLPKTFDNPNVMDGTEEELKIGEWKFKGHNILHVETVSDEIILSPFI